MSIDIPRRPRPAPPADADTPPSRAAVRTGRLVVAAIVLAGVLGTLAVVHDAQTASPVISVPAAAHVAHPPADAAQAVEAVLSFVPSGSTLSVRTAIATATGNAQASLGATSRVGRFGRGWSVVLAVPVRVAGLEHRGLIFTSGGQGSSDPQKGLLDVTAGSVQYVVRFDPATRMATYAFRLAGGGATLSAMDWNANSVVTQTSVGNGDLP